MVFKDLTWSMFLKALDYDTEVLYNNLWLPPSGMKFNKLIESELVKKKKDAQQTLVNDLISNEYARTMNKE